MDASRYIHGNEAEINNLEMGVSTHSQSTKTLVATCNSNPSFAPAPCCFPFKVLVPHIHSSTLETGQQLCYKELFLSSNVCV